jgi:hypothetical protein
VTKLSTLATAASAGLAVIATGCGGSSGDKTETVTAPVATTAPLPTTAPAVTTSAAPPTRKAASAAVRPPAGSTKVGSSSGGGAHWTRYTTSSSPKAVVADYRKSLTAAGWSIVAAGAQGGGWGPYGGSGAGVTGKKAGAYTDVQAGAARGSKTYFEVCVGPGSRTACDRLSTKGDSASGGSHPAGDDPATSSGAS